MDLISQKYILWFACEPYMGIYEFDQTVHFEKMSSRSCCKILSSSDSFNHSIYVKRVAHFTDSKKKFKRKWTNYKRQI